MPLKYDPRTSEISYEGKCIGKYDNEGDVPRVHIEITYECKPQDNEWSLPLTWFAYGLNLLNKHQQPKISAELSIKTEKEDIEEEFEVLRFLTEVTVKRQNFIWQFHQNDADIWPSKLHGHDYDKGLTLDALTGEIFDVATKQKCKMLNKKKLKYVQQELKKTVYFEKKITTLLGLI